MSLIRQIPNLLTCLNLAMGVAGIINAFVGDYTNTIFFILTAGIFDFLDGFLARYLGSSGDFGKELDSLADMVTFGALPSIYCFQWAYSGGAPVWMAYGAILVAIFSALRLARFNLGPPSDEFQGLPTPANAIMLTTLGQLTWSEEMFQIYFPGIILGSCALLVSGLPMISLKFKSFGIRENRHRYLLIILLLALFGLLGIRSLPYFIPAYIFLSVVAVITSRSVKSNT